MAVNHHGGEGPSGATHQGVALAIHVAQGVLQEVPASLQLGDCRIALGIQFSQFTFDGWQQYALILAEVVIRLLAGNFKVTQVGTA